MTWPFVDKSVDQRTWGFYEVLFKSDKYKFRKVIIYLGQKLFEAERVLSEQERVFLVQQGYGALRLFKSSKDIRAGDTFVIGEKTDFNIQATDATLVLYEIVTA